MYLFGTSFSFSIILWRFIRIVCFHSLFIFLLGSFPWYACTSLFNHLPIEGYLDCSQFLAIADKAAGNICIQFLSEHKF